jgi:hypothetical protein
MTASSDPTPIAESQPGGDDLPAITARALRLRLRQRDSRFAPASR